MLVAEVALPIKVKLVMEVPEEAEEVVLEKVARLLMEQEVQVEETLALMELWVIKEMVEMVEQILVVVVAVVMVLVTRVVPVDQEL
jgi:hypothetical protein